MTRSKAVGLGGPQTISHELPGPPPDTLLSVSLLGLSKDSSQSLVRGAGLGQVGGLLAWEPAMVLGARGGTELAVGHRL